MFSSSSVISPAAEWSRSSRLVITAALLCLAAMSGYGLLALALGQDANWDLRNYHYYDAYAFLTGRQDFDVVPAHVPTFYNPLLYVPFYWLVQAAPPKLVGFTLGAFQGLNFALVMVLAWRLLAIADPWRRCVVAAALAGSGMFGAMALSEIGASFGDNVVSLFVLGGLAILVWNYDRLIGAPRRVALPLAALAGLLPGLAAGLKQPDVLFAAGLCLACLALRAPWQRRLAAALCFGLGVLAGIAITDGFWLINLWQRYANPMFPYFNEYYRSPWATIGDYRDVRFIPHSWWTTLVLPFRFTFGRTWVAEIRFFDLRPVVVECLFLLWPLAALWRRFRPAGGAGWWLAQPGPASLVLATMLFSWALWVRLFGIYRYIVPLEFIMPLAIVLLADRLPAAPRLRGAIAAVLVALVVVIVRPGLWHRVPWSDAYFGVSVPPLAQPDDAVVLMIGKDPTAYVVPAFPPSVRFIRIEGWFTGPSPQPNRFDLRMHEIVERSHGPLYALFRGEAEQQTARDALKAYGLSMREGECQPLKIAIEQRDLNPLLFCPVVRAH